MKGSEGLVTGKMICADLKKLGLKAGDTVLVHSSLSSIGKVEGGADTVIDTLLEVIGKKGTLLMPSFPAGSEHELLRNGLIFDLKTSPSGLGIIPETFRKRKNAIRSLNPTHSIAAIGAQAEEIAAGHEHCNVSAGRNTPFEKLIRTGGKILLLGVTHDSNTTLHFIENTNGAPTLSRELFRPLLIDMDGRTHVVPTHPHMPGLRRRYQCVESDLLDAGIQKNGKLGNALSRLIDASAMTGIIGGKIQKDPLYLIETFCP